MKHFSSPSPTKSSGISRSCSSLDLQQRFCSPKRSREVNENEQEFQNQSLKSQKPKKPVGMKNFMSPTVSAASKAVVPRKKILAERNEPSSGVIIPTDTPVHVTPIPNANNAPEDLGLDDLSVRSSQTTPLSSRVTEPEADDLPEPLAQPYDPFTNYLSPRPKYLRYNPNRRMEILHRRENELRRKGDELLGVNPTACSLDSQKLAEEEGLSQVNESLSSSFGDSLVKQEDSSTNSQESSPRRPGGDEENNEHKDHDQDRVDEVGEEKPLAEANDFSASSLRGGRSGSDEMESRSIIAKTDGFEEQNKEDVKEVEEEEEEEEEEEGEEEEEEERKWCMKDFLRWLKWLFLLVIFFIAIPSLSPMNSSIATPSQALWNIKEGYEKLQCQISQAAISDFMVSDLFFNLEQEEGPGSMEAEGVKNEERTPGYLSHEIDEMFDPLEGITAEMSKSCHVSHSQIELQYMKDMDIVFAETSSETQVKSDPEKNVETLAVELTSDKYQETNNAVQSEHPEVVSWNLEGPSLTSNSYQVREEATEIEKPEPASLELNHVGVERIANELISDKETDDALKSEHPEVVSWNLEGPSLTSNSYQVRDEATEIEKPEPASSEFNPVGVERVANELEKAVDVTNANRIDKTFSLKDREVGETHESEEQLKSPVNDLAFNMIDNQIIRFKNLSSEMRVPGTESVTAHSISMLAMAGISFLTIIALSTALQFLHLMRKKPLAKESSPTAQQSPTSKVVELKNLSIPDPKEVYGIEKAESSANPSSLVHLGGKGFEGLYQTQTPKVELLGEYVVVGQFNSSSLKRHNMESSPTESEASSLSWSQEKRPRRKGTTNANYEFSSISEFSAVQSQSHSYGSFTTQEKIVMKEEGKVVTTPVRRSSRLANRAVTSP